MRERVSACVSVNVWVHAGACGCVWMCVDVCGCVWVCVCVGLHTCECMHVACV